MEQAHHDVVSTLVQHGAQHVANVAVYGGAAATIAFWGLKISDVCAIISTTVAVLGFALQVVLALRRSGKL